MKVLHAAETAKGGVSTVMKSIASTQISEYGVENIKVIIPLEHTDFLDIDIESKILFKRKSRSFFSLLSLFFLLLKTIYRFKPDVLHLHSTFAGVLGRLALIFVFKNKPKVIYCPHAFPFLMENNFIKRKLYVYIERFFSHFSDIIICVSNYEREIAVTAGLDSNKLIVIHNGVNGPKIYTEKIIRTNKLEILFVGRFDYQKGYDLLIEIMKELVGSSEEVSFTLAGDFVNSSSKDRLIADNIQYVGWKTSNELSYLIRESDFVFIPSRWEGFAMVPIESFSYSTPVIVSKHPSFKEIVENKKNGYIVDVYNKHEVLSLFKKLSDKKIAGKNFEDYRKNSYKRYSVSFTEIVMIEKYKSAYDNIMKELK